MKSLHYIILMISGVLIIPSCETTEKIDDFPLRPSQLVLNCFFAADSTWEFQVSHSLSVLDNARIELIDSATILLFRNELPVDTLQAAEEDGLYRSGKILPGVDDKYSVTVTAPGFDVELRAEDYVPVPVPLQRLQATIIDSSFHTWEDYESGRPITQGRLEGTVELQFQDPPGTANYYQLAMYYFEEHLGYEDTIFHLYRSRVNFTSQDATSGETAFGSGALLTDQFFDGMSHTIKTTFYTHGQRNGQRVFYVELTSLTESAYLYKRSIEDYQSASGDPFSEPVLVYGNIENGLGIFAGYATTTDSLVMF